jgi:hypothetical protein
MWTDNISQAAFRALLQANTTSGTAPASTDNGTAPAIDINSPNDIAEPHEGVWAPAWDVVLCLLPIVFLVVTTLWRPVRLSTTTSLPLAALTMWFIRLAYLKLDANFTNSAVIYGLFDALKTLSIITGAICLFQSMEATMVRASADTPGAHSGR